MTTYLESLEALCAEENAKRAAARSAETVELEKQWSDRLTPLEQRVAKLLADIPPSVQARGLSLEALRGLLAGKWRGNCHPGELGNAMRKLGWKRQRDWSDADSGFRARWFKENSP